MSLILQPGGPVTRQASNAPIIRPDLLRVLTSAFNVTSAPLPVFTDGSGLGAPGGLRTGYLDRPKYTLRGYYNNGTSEAIIRYGEVGKYFAFDGARLAMTTSHPAIAGTGASTLLMLVRFNSTASTQIISGNFSASQSPVYKYGRGFILDGTTLRLACADNNSKNISVAAPATGVWHALAGRFNTTDGAIFLNGQKVASGDLSSGYQYYEFALGSSGYSLTDFSKAFNGDIGLHLYFSSGLSDSALADLTRSVVAPWAVLAPNPRCLWIPAASGGALDLTLQNAAHAHSAEVLSLSSTHALIAAAAAHAHSADNLALSSSMALAVANATHAHTAAAPTLSAALFLLIQNTLHAHAAGNVTLDNSGAAVLTIADALHAHAADPLAISQAVTLAVANALHPHTADAPTLQTLVSLMIAHAQHAHTADQVAFGVAVIELVQDLMLDAIYQSGDFGLAVDCLLGQAAFTAFLDTADDDFFAAQSTGHTLRYRMGVPLQTNDQVTIGGTLYRVVGAPRQINVGEMRAALVRVPS